MMALHSVQTAVSQENQRQHPRPAAKAQLSCGESSAPSITQSDSKCLKTLLNYKAEAQGVPPVI